MTKLEKVFSLFVGSDEVRPIFWKPWKCNGYTYATNSHILIRAPSDQCDFESSENEKSPKCDHFFINQTMDYVLPIKSIDIEKYRTKDELEGFDEDGNCMECRGSGEVRWIYNCHSMNGECPECKGSGIGTVQNHRKTGHKIFENVLIKIIGSGNLEPTYIKIQNFSKVMEVAKILGTDLILKDNKTSSSPVVMKAGICEMLVMPVISQDKILNGSIIDLSPDMSLKS